MKRRTFLALAAAVPLSAAGAYAFFRDPARAADFTAPLFIPGAGGPFGVLEPQGELTLVAEHGAFPLAGGGTTPFLWYRARHGGKDYQNPILKVRSGARLPLTLNNALDEGTIIHWHGLHLPGAMDGHPATPSARAARTGTISRSATAGAPTGTTPTRIYRFRLLNGSNARIYRLAFVKDGRALPYHVIGTDGGLLDRPYPVTEAFLAPGERLDVMLDAGGLAVGDAVYLRSLAFDPREGEGMMGGAMGGMIGGGMGGMMGGAMGRPGAAPIPNGQTFDIMKLAVTHRVDNVRRLPERLSRVQPIDFDAAATRTVDLTMGHMRWLINGESYREDAYPIQVRRGSTEVWEIRNARHSMPHPMHLHGFQFQVLSRHDSPAQVRALGGHGNGRAAADLGWKDTVLVWPGETVRLAVDFSHDFGGDQVYVFHCHNLEHEDSDMMVNVLVRA